MKTSEYISLIGVAVSLCWNLWNTYTGWVKRKADRKDSRFTALIATPLETSIARLQDFEDQLTELTVKRNYSGNPTSVEWKNLQDTSFATAMAKLQRVLQRVTHDPDFGRAQEWYKIEDFLDPVYDGFDRLTTANASEVEIKRGINQITKAISATLAEARKMIWDEKEKF